MGTLVNDREIMAAEAHHVDGKYTLIHEWDRVGNHRLRLTDRKYRVGSENRHVVGQWVGYQTIATLIDGGMHGRQFAGTTDYYQGVLPPVFLIFNLPDGEPL